MQYLVSVIDAKGYSADEPRACQSLGCLIADLSIAPVPDLARTRIRQLPDHRSMSSVPPSQAGRLSLARARGN